MMGFNEILFMFLLPAALAIAAFAALAFARRPAVPGRAWPGWDGASLAVIVGAAWVGMVGLHAIPPGDAHHWLPWFTLLVAVVALLAPPAIRPAWGRVAASAVVIAVLLGLLLGRLPVCHGWSMAEKVGWFGGLGLAWLVLAGSSQRLAQLAGPGVVVSGLLLSAAVSAAAFALYGSARYAMLSAPICVALGVFMVLGWWRPAVLRTPGLAAVATLLVPLLWMFAYFLAELPLWSLPLLALSSQAGWLTTSGRLRGLAGWKRLLILAAAAGILVAPVLVYGIVKSVRDSGEGPY